MPKCCPNGLRLSELLALRWSDVDWAGGRLVVLQTLDSRHDGVVRFKATKTHLLDVSGLPHLPLHGLRHTMATLMLAAGEHPKVVSERLGHSNPSFTLAVYGHVVPGMHEAASRRLEETLALPPSAETAGGK